MFGSSEQRDQTMPTLLVSMSKMKLFCLIIDPPMIISLDEPKGSIAKQWTPGFSTKKYSDGYHHRAP